MQYFCIFLGLLFCAGGVFFASGKAHVHLEAWKRMPEEEKARIRILPLCRTVGHVIFLSGLIVLGRGIWADCPPRLFTVAMVAWMIYAGWNVWHISRSGRYRNS